MPRKKKPERPENVLQPGTPPIQARPMPRALPDGTRGFVRPDGRSYWQARRTDDWTTVWRGWATPQEIAHALARLASNGLLASNRSAAHVIKTVGDLLDHWKARQAERPDLAPKTQQHYEKAARHIVAWLRDVLLIQVDRDTVERFRDDRLREGASPRLVVQELRILSMAWRWGQEHGYVPARSLPHVRIKVEGYVANHRTPSPSEVGLIMEHLSGEYHLAVRLLAATGARIGEVCGLRGRDFDPRTRYLTLGGKTGSRTFPLPPEVAALIADRADRGDRPLLDLPPTAPDVTVRVHIAGACRKAGIPVFTPHGLRRMVVDQFLHAGLNPKVVASLTGHSDVVMLKFYASAPEADRVAAVVAAGLGRLPTTDNVVEGPWGPVPVHKSGTD